MSNMTVVTTILSSVIGMMGALVAGMSVYFTYKGRHNLLRQIVYGRQMDAYFDVIESMTALYTVGQNALAFSNPRLTDEDARGQFRMASREEHERFTGIVNRSLIILPSKVKAAVDHFNETLLAMSAPSERRPAGPPNAASHPSDPARDLAIAYGRAVNSIRHHLAIDSLTTGMLKEMGVGSESVMLKSVCGAVNPLAPIGRVGS